MERRTDMTRRVFLKGTAGGIGGFLVLETLGGCGGGGGGGGAGLNDVHATFPTAFTETTKPTACWIGKQDCGMFARILAQDVGGQQISRIVKLEGNPSNPRNNGKLCPKGQGQIVAVYDYNRVKTPLKRTNAKGVQGTFVQASWDEALSLVASKLNEAKSAGQYVLWQKGRSKAEPLYDKAFVDAMKAAGFKTYKIGHGAYCSDAGYRASEYTIGFHGNFHPDFRYTNYVLNWGWNLTNAGGNKFCWITWPQLFLDARARGMKIVTLDPRGRGVGPHTDEWLPIKPGTDLAFFLGLVHAILAGGTIDRTYLSTYTNAPFLVGVDGLFLRGADGKELVWDANTGTAVAHDTAGISPALEGTYAVEGATATPALDVLRTTAAAYTPDWADEMCDLPAGTVARIAGEIVQNARIGETITIDGVTLPLRPVGLHGYHITQQEQGFQASRAALVAFMLVGAVGVPGGTMIDIKADKPHDNWTKLDTVSIKDPPYTWDLGSSKYFPIQSTNPSFLARVLVDPAQWGVDPDTLPKVAIFHMHNGAVSFADTPAIRAAWAQIPFIAVLDPWLSETASLFADVIFPIATLEKYEGPLSAKAPYADAKGLRIPLMSPLWESKGDIDTYIEIADRTGFLFGDTGYIAQANTQLKLVANPLDVNAKPDARTVLDAWAKEQGKSIEYFEEHGVTTPSAITADKAYPSAKDYFGAKHRLYGESLLKYRTTMISKGAGENYYRDYQPLPVWRAATMDASPQEYDLTLISYKKVEFKQSRATFVPVVGELGPRQELLIHPDAAQARGIADGDTVTVESHNAVTGEHRTVQAVVRTRQAMRPDTVAMSHHYGMWTHPSTAGQGPTPNELFFVSEGYAQCTMDSSFQVKVRVSKA